MYKLETPILFLAFNRPDTTKLVFETIRQAQPGRLYIAADGPRPAKDGEVLKTDEVRRICSDIDWQCEVHTLFRESNLGCGKAVSEAITWFFEHEEEGIILEDDCLPDISFFRFCSVMLDRYRNDSRIMHIGGTNFQFGTRRGDGDYYYSVIPHVWGWATWRRAWYLYEFDLNKPKPLPDDVLSSAFGNEMILINHFKEIFSLMENKGIDTWDYQWFHTLIRNNGLAVIPNINLIKNIGFRDDATHTLAETSWNTLNTAGCLETFQSPSKKENHAVADAFTFREVMGIFSEPENSSRPRQSFARRIFRRFAKIMGN